MRNIVRAIACIGLAIITFVSAGCWAKNVAAKVVTKAYELTVTVETYVQKVDSEKLVATASQFESPMVILASALEYVASVTEGDVSDKLAVVVKTIDEILVLIDGVTLENVESVRAELLTKVGSVKESIVSAGKAVGVEFPTVVLANVSIDDIFAKIGVIAEELKEIAEK